MTSSVFFKFKSQKEPSRVEFDGTGISVFELKREIILKSGLGDGTEFDLAIYNEDGNEEYDDDTTIIPRSTSIIARRLPPLKPGAGRAARYVSGKMPINAKNSSRKEPAVPKTNTKQANSTTSMTKMSSAMTEEERMAAMFQAQSEQWSAQQDELAQYAQFQLYHKLPDYRLTYGPSQTPVMRPSGNKKGGPQLNVPDHEPPVGYICYRCGEKGHWIQACPTNDDPNFDNKPRVKRTTGIPRSFLRTVEKPVALANDGTTDEKAPSGVMVNADGEFVVAEPDKASWELFQAKTKSSAAAQKASASGDRELQERGLECPIDKRMFIDPMKTPCCGKTYCNECITNALIESDFTCPGCQTDEVFIDNLIPDEDVSKQIKAYIEEKNSAKNEKDRSESPKVKTETVETRAPEPTGGKEKIKSPSPAARVKTPVNSSKLSSPMKLEVMEAGYSVQDPSAPQKRPAEEVLENPRIPKGPKAMQQQLPDVQIQNQIQQTQQQDLMNGTNSMAGFPGLSNMPFDVSQYAMNGFGGMGMNMNNMNMMNGYGMGMPSGLMTGMGMTPMMGMPPFPMNGGFPNMNGMHNSGMGYGAMGGGNTGFSNQQKTTFAQPMQNEEDNAYFRKPVNPHRHQGRQKRARPSDYREL